MERYGSVQAGSLILGDGIPKICVPIVAKDRKEVLKEAEAIRTLPADLVEWRLDWLSDPWEAKEILLELRPFLGERPLLLTFRTKNEGGRRDFPVQDYVKLNRELLEMRMAELVDVELFTGEEAVQRLVQAAREAGSLTVMSSHEFGHTPSREEMLQRLLRMQELDADITKLAVMPRTWEDVTRLLAVSTAMREEYADRPFITMSMGGKGFVSRICGAMTGSAVTFGSAAEASAPGQMKAEELSAVLKLIRGQMGE